MGPYPDSKSSPSPQDPGTVVSYSLKMAARYWRLGGRGVCRTGPKMRPVMVARAGPRHPDADPPSRPHRATAADFGVSALFSTGETLGTRKWWKPRKPVEGGSNSSPLWHPQEKAQETGRAASRNPGLAACRARRAAGPQDPLQRPGGAHSPAIFRAGGKPQRRPDPGSWAKCASRWT